MQQPIHIVIRNTRPEDIPGIIALTMAVYPDSRPWSETQLASHLEVFPEGQFVAVERESKHIAGMSASLIIPWDDYEMESNWRDFTAGGLFTNHDPTRGRTLYGAEVMVHPDFQGGGVGKKLYRARRDLVEGLGLRRIRAGSRLRGFHYVADRMSAQEYVRQVVRGKLTDPTLNFQLKQGFRVLAVVSGYLRNDPESLGQAAVIEWINRKVLAEDRRWARSQTTLSPGSLASNASI
ncbi:MAG: GNAT family N-acetyltransferase [Acidobacteria bacterium]|nr:GNAT family N-acetyltransferase [Acidobacteriota bacterium]